MIGKRIGYIRVSTADQNPDRQLEGIELDRKFIDKASGTIMNRPQLELLLDYIRDDDIVFVHSMDRLARNVKNLIELVEIFVSKGAELRFIKENLIFNGKDSALSKLLLLIIGAVAEFEHALIRERQAEGVALAKKRGAYKKGRKLKITSEVKQKIIEEMKTRKKKIEIAKELGISRFSLYKCLQELNKEDME